MSAPNPAPGWYPAPDGSGQQQYWDGQAWINNRAAMPVQSQGPRLQSNRNSLLVFGAIALAVIFYAIYQTKFWETDGYKQCVAQQESAFSHPDSSITDPIEKRCHDTYG